MNIKIKGIKARVDKDKAVVELEHSFHPLKDDDSVEVICEYFKTGERDSLAKMDGDGEMRFDFASIFRKKVRKINGLSVDAGYGPEVIDTPDKLLAFPGIPALDAIVRSTAMHLLVLDGISEEEEKNYVSDTNA